MPEEGSAYTVKGPVVWAAPEVVQVGLAVQVADRSVGCTGAGHAAVLPPLAVEAPSESSGAPDGRSPARSRGICESPSHAYRLQHPLPGAN